MTNNTPQFQSEADLIAWLDTLYECDENGPIHNLKWAPAQQAIAGIRAQSAAGLIEAGALRQFRHNDGGDELVFAYDKAITDRIVAPYAERIRLLTEELAKDRAAWLSEMKADADLDRQGGAQSIDTPEFREYVRKCSATWDTYEWDTHLSDLIAYIDGRTAGTAPEGYVLVPKKLPAHVVDAIASASYDLDDTAREIVSEDWACSLAIISECTAAPSLSGTEEAKP